MSNHLTKADAASIEAEYLRYKAEDVSETIPLRDRILASWERDSPKMWASLQDLGLTKKMAFVVQERMWRRKDELMKLGFPVTDAREMAEREELFLEPEPQERDNRELPTELQDASPYTKDLWRRMTAHLNTLEE